MVSGEMDFLFEVSFSVRLVEFILNVFCCSGNGDFIGETHRISLEEKSVGDTCIYRWTKETEFIKEIPRIEQMSQSIIFSNIRLHKSQEEFDRNDIYPSIFLIHSLLPFQLLFLSLNMQHTRGLR